jgi:Cytochrome P460
MRFTLISIGVLAACEPVPTTSTMPTSAATEPAIAAPAPDVLDARFVTQVRDAVSVYPYWSKVDEAVRPAPAPCSMGVEPPAPGQVRMSAASEGPHVAKLFYLYPSDRAAYISDKPVPVGFTIVKESYAPVRQAEANGYTVTVDGVHYAMGDRTGLFAMMKVAETEGTDRQWIYAILDTDFTVRAAGGIERCAKCHEDATHERLFGVEVRGSSGSH